MALCYFYSFSPLCAHKTLSLSLYAKNNFCDNAFCSEVAHVRPDHLPLAYDSE